MFCRYGKDAKSGYMASYALYHYCFRKPKQPMNLSKPVLNRTVPGSELAFPPLVVAGWFVSD